MKKLFTLGLLSIVLFNQKSSAQIGKGQIMIGGGLAVNSQKTTYTIDASLPEAEVKSTSIEIAPQIGFGLGNNWIVGIKPGFGILKDKTINFSGEVTESKMDVLSLAVFARKFHPFGDRFGIFGQLEAGYGMGKNVAKTTPSAEVESKTKTMQVAVKPGAFFKAGKRFVIEATVGNIGYSTTENKPSSGGSKTTTNGFNFSLTNSLGLGFQVIL